MPQLPLDKSPGTVDLDTLVGRVGTLESGGTLTSPTITSPTVTSGSFTSPTLTTPAGVVVAQEAAFTQVAGNKTHTATFTIPAGATILDVIVTNTAVWDSGTTAVLNIGTSGDPDSFFAAVDLKTVPAAGKSINFAHPGASNGGASVPEIDGGAGNTQLGATNAFLYKATAQTVTAVVVDTNVSGAAGRTRVTILYSLPPTVIAPVVQ